MNVYAAATIINVVIILLVGVAIYWTESLWAFLGFLFLMEINTSKVKTECPKCYHKFTAIHKEDD